VTEVLKKGPATLGLAAAAMAGAGWWDAHSRGLRHAGVSLAVFGACLLNVLADT
jgi:hypothetical protein